MTPEERKVVTDIVRAAAVAWTKAFNEYQRCDTPETRADMQRKLKRFLELRMKIRDKSEQV